MGRTLWQIWTEKEPEKPQVYNPIKAEVGSLISIDAIDFRDLTLKVTAINEVRRVIGGESFFFADYDLTGGKKPIRLRVSSPGAKLMPDQIVVLTLYDEFAYAKDFENVVRDPSKLFRIDEERAEFYRINDVNDPYRASVSSIPTSTRNITYWDYWRETKDEAGNKLHQFLFVEMDDKNGWFQIWRGEEIPPQMVTVI